MKITEKQFLVLYITCMESTDIDFMRKGCFSYDIKARKTVLEGIFKQSSGDIEIIKQAKKQPK